MFHHGKYVGHLDCFRRLNLQHKIVNGKEKAGENTLTATTNRLPLISLKS